MIPARPKAVKQRVPQRGGTPAAASVVRGARSAGADFHDTDERGSERRARREIP
jgi:hypothetical protein